MQKRLQAQQLKRMVPMIRTKRLKLIHVHQYAKGSKDNSSSKPKAMNFAKATNEKTKQVTFIVAIPSSWKGEVFLIFGHPHFCDWKSAALQLERTGEFGDKLDMINGTVEVPNFVCKGTPYKYVVQGNDGNVEWEYLNTAYNNHYRNRWFYIPDERYNLGNYFQFDDLVVPKYQSSSWFSWLPFGSNEISNSQRQKEAKLIFLHYFKKIIDKDKFIKVDPLNNMLLLYDLISSFFYSFCENGGGRVWKHLNWEKLSSPKDTSKILFGVVEKILKNHTVILSSNQTEPHQKKVQTLLSTMSLIPLFVTFGDQVSVDLGLLLMENLSTEKIETLALEEGLKKSFGATGLEFILDSFIEYWKYILKYPKVKSSISWLLPLPLMHLVERITLRRFPEQNIISLTIDKCGLFGLKNHDLPSKSDIQILMGNINMMSSSLQRDPELQRTIVLLIDVRQFPIALVHGVKPKLLIRKFITSQTENDHLVFSDDDVLFLDTLKSCIKLLTKSDFYYVTEALVDLAIVTLSKTKEAHKFPYLLFHFVEVCLKNVSEETEQHNGMFEKLKNVLSQKREKFYSALAKFGSVYWFYKDIEGISCFLWIIESLWSMQLLNEDFENEMKKKIIHIINYTIKEIYQNDKDKFFALFCEMEFKDFIKEALELVFEKNIEILLNEGRLLSYFGYTRPAEMLCQKVNQLWETLKDDDERFNWIITYNPLKTILKHFWGKEGNKVSIVLDTASNILIDYCESLTNSEITFKKFNQIKQHQQRFYDFMCIISPEDKATIIQTFNKRNLEYDLYKHTSAIVNGLAALLRNLPDKIGKTDTFFEKGFKKEDGIRFIDVYKYGAHPSEYFQIQREALQLLDKMFKRNLLTSSIFQMKWRQCLTSLAGLKLDGAKIIEKLPPKSLFLNTWDSILGEEIKDDLRLPFNIKQVIAYIILPSLNLTFNSLKELCGGEIPIPAALNYMKHCTNLVKELDELNLFFEASIPEADIQNCARRIQCANAMSDCVEQSDAILQTASVLGLEGEFNSIKMIRDKASTGQTSLLKEITEELIADTDKVMQVSPEMKQVFKAVADNLPLLKWLKEHLKDAKEVKVFVEMMSIAAGESDYEVDRVANFEACCQAFSPIIFELNNKSGFKEFQRACQRTAEAVRNGDGIIEKLNSSNNNLEWFKQAKESQGSVSARSFLEAKKANSNGKYIIGNLTGKADFFFEQTAALHHVVKLKVVYEGDKVQTKDLSLDDVHDLQSRLMLLGRDNNKTEESIKEGIFEKEYFVKQAEMVTQLADTYVRLIEAGDVNFLNWKKEYQCNVEEARKKGFKEYFKGIENEIRSFENRLSAWNDELMQFRMENPYANHFSVKQMLVLRKYLKQYSSSSTKPIINNQVFTLLRSISEEVTVKKVKECCVTMYASSTKPLAKDQRKSQDNETNFTRFTFKELGVMIKKFLKENDDIEKEVVLASLMQVPDFRNEKKVILWCGKHEDDEDLIEELSEKAEAELEKMQENDLSGCNEDELDTEIPDNLEKDYLPLNLFANFLNHFGTINHCRTIPQYLQKHQPNLIIIPKDEILASVIAMYDNDGSASLPSSSEVLLCSDDVSLEQVEMLIMRAAMNEDGMFCLAFAENLNYETSEKVFAFLQKIMKEKNMGYLVVICSSEEENQSYLASALDSYQRQCVHRKRDISSILSKAFCLKEEIKQNKKGGKKLYGPTVDEDSYNIRVVSSARGGMGKSLLIDRKSHQLDKYIVENATVYQKERFQRYQTLVRTPVHGTAVCYEDVVSKLAENSIFDADFPRIYHFDIAPTVQEGLDILFFNVFVLGSMQTKTGKVWRKNNNDMCYVEMTKISKKVKEEEKKSASIVLDNLPKTECASPEEALKISKGELKTKMLFEANELNSSQFQRVFQYLQMYEKNSAALNTFDYKHIDQWIDVPVVLQYLLQYCGIPDPSWMELRNFVHFFNKNLLDCEQSVFTNTAFRQDFPGFRVFVVTFLLEMARDFATRSLDETDKQANNDLVHFKRTWEQSAHPYLFFNTDGHSMTFFGINITPNRHLIDPETQNIIKQNIMEKQLYEILDRQMAGDFINFRTNFNDLSKLNKIKVLCRVMGLPDGDEHIFDPDPTYELTIDNMKKMLAIHMRLRCGVPVVLMGETGCGKTTLIRFMCSLCAGPATENQRTPKNMLLVKVHGGITMDDIRQRVVKALEMAEANNQTNTVLFLDEANTTDAIGLIKEVMVDKMLFGKPLAIAQYGLDIIAACNPYRQHTNEMVKKLETAGLGYHVGAVDTYEKMGEIPLRQLVYRVHPLPESMKPLVWDFGQLNSETEQLYARQIITRYKMEGKLPLSEDFIELLIRVLAASQLFMRNQKDECSFVSLRDVERAVQVTSWFHEKMGLFLPMIQEFDQEHGIVIDIESKYQESIEKQRRSLILALAVCYIARLEDRNDYYDYIEKFFINDFALEGGVNQMKNEIKRFQEMFINQLHLEDNIAKNQALCENVFMMVICIELRIPLFVVGKPGSSKSLAKTIVQDNMQGKNSKCELFQNFKQVFMSSYQCSPLSTADGIIGVFKQSARFQEQKNLDEYTSVVVLDEVGLAEDSPRMPLKALHPLLEDGTDGSEDLTMTGSDSKSKRVAFIGISNWALDPAKMNRGIMLSRSPPAFDELFNTARDICASKKSIQTKILPLLKELSQGYNDIYNVQRNTESLKQFKKEEFFGLRDFYSLIKLVFCLAKKYDGKPPTSEIKNAICRNFSGMNEIEPWPIFKRNLQLDENEDGAEDEENTMSTVDMIRKSFEPTCACSVSTNNINYNNQIKKRCTSNRYLLVMTEKYSALPIIEGMSLDENLTVIFGSSFPKDQEFTQVCRDINRIKMCMETGRTVILLNMENLYESLYDALNQYYVYMGGQRYVDLGLGTHRVKCRVHEDFKLIVMADKTNVYKTFPIPLINRLEKHFLVTATAMEPEQLKIERELTKWANHFAKAYSGKKKFDCEDAFIGYNNDTCASIIIELYRHMEMPNTEEFLDLSKKKLLQVATPDSMARLPKDERNKYWDVYFKEQIHSSLPEFLCKDIPVNQRTRFYQIKTFSRLLSPQELENIEVLGFQIESLSLMQFQTENSFREALRSTYQKVEKKNSIILVQYSLTKTSGDLVPCAQHITKEIASQVENGDTVKVVFLLQLTRGAKSLVSYQSIWECIHIDEIRQDDKPKLIDYIGKPISSLFEENYDWFHLIQSSVQGGIEIVNKKSAMKADVITKKINILHQLLQRDTDVSKRFSDHILHQMYARLLEIEQKEVDLKKVANWVPEEAVELRYIPNYGTFGEALVRCVEEKVCPILGDLVYELDFNNNLMLIANSLQFIDLWLELFEVLVCATSRNDVSRFPKRIENCRFPFSQHIIVIMDNMINENHQPNAIAKVDPVMTTVSEAPFGKVLLKCGQQDLMKYLLDFVVVHFPGVSNLFELLSECLLIEMNKLVQELNKANIETEEDQGMEENSKTEYFQSIPMLHLTYEKCKDSFANAIQLLRTLPHLIQGVFNKLESGVPLDIIALNEFLNDLLPEDDPIEDVKVYAAVKGLKKTIQTILLHCERDELRKWAQVKMLHLFVNDVVYSSSKPQQSSGTLALNALYKHIQDLPDAMCSIESWIIFEKFLKNTVVKKDGDDTLRENCLQFFIDVVVEFCFSKEAFERIDQETVIPHIMGYAFTQNAGGGTKRFSPVEDYHDDSPVIRSFILQQLLSRGIKVEKYIEDYLEENLRLIRRSTNNKAEADVWNMCKIFIYCYQDHLTNTKFNVFKRNGELTRHYLDQVSTTLKEARDYFSTSRPNNSLDVQLLEKIAQTRVCLSACADILSTDGSTFIQQSNDPNLKKEHEIVIAALSLLIRQVKNTDVHMFLHRQIIHLHGKQELHKISTENPWSALDTPGNDQNNTNFDRFLVYDEQYKVMRTTISTFFLHPDDPRQLQRISNKTKDHIKELATLHFEVFSDIQINQQQKDVLTKEMKLKNLDNYLTMTRQNDDKNILEFLYHLAVVLKHSKSDFIAVFQALANSPQTLKNCYLPAMPSDNFSAIMAVGTKRYECPCGYPYVITECGGAMQEFACPQCRRTIGGSNHSILPGQKLITNAKDDTKPGHCLGDAKKRSLDAIPERELTRISVVLQRILIHLSMLLGYLKGHQMDIHALITPNPTKDVIQFFTEHVLHDLYLIKKGLNLNEDRAKLVVHLLLKILMKNTNKNDAMKVQHLNTENGRTLNEKRFDEQIIKRFTDVS
ncbi:E3 ubiquitin-protein ligase rnf213-alpha-like [Clytia hemisphaerica]|uniref:E3 ubiquitin-protein ligase rnf213-alpha-like n=1 Tax=Clytia hemisphaerica TaxID=252671 RepID=UPI0034D6DA70